MEQISNLIVSNANCNNFLDKLSHRSQLGSENGK